MTKARLEAFSDGVIAIIITIMVLELRAPHGSSLEELRPLLPKVATYLMSFIFVGVYWSNHHHMLHVTDRVNGAILWANLHLLFWLSLTPFVTAWMGENLFAEAPTAVYGVVMVMSAVAYTILEKTIIAYQGAHSKLREAVGSDLKGYASLAIYIAAIPLAFVNARISLVLFATVTLMWLVPDRRIERRL